ncbi:MAG: L,D-transpeptidase [Aquisalimonadaceae bacterium]
MPGNVPDSRWLKVDLNAQSVELRQGERLLQHYPVSTAAAGPGERDGSGCTPRGWHVIRARIGEGCPSGAVFKGRRWTGEIWTPVLMERQPGRDWILTRILWLSGLERGYNRLGNVDTMRRFIYFHGCPDSLPLGVPGSKGCIRMRNADVLELHDRVPAGTRVWIG